MYFTKFEDIYRLFLGSIQDYHLKDMFEKNPEVAEDMMETFLKRAVYKFENCVKDVKDIDLINKSFRCELDLEEQNIVANLMVLSWLEWNTQNTTFMNPTLTDNDFKHFSEEKNLDKKMDYYDELRERVYQDMTQYGLYHTPFKRWAVGDYGI